jgi:hypothetical protein
MIEGVTSLVAPGRTDDDPQRLNKELVQIQSSEVQSGLMAPSKFSVFFFYACSISPWGNCNNVHFIIYKVNLCSKNHLKIGKIAIFSRKRFFPKKSLKKSADFLAIFWRFFRKKSRFFRKNRGSWQKIVCLKKFRKLPGGGGGMMCFGVQRRVILPY